MSLRDGKCSFGGVNGTSVTYRPVSVVIPLLAFQRVPAHVINNGVRVYSDGTCGSNIVMNIGDKSVSVHDSYVCIYRKLSLGMNI